MRSLFFLLLPLTYTLSHASVFKHKIDKDISTVIKDKKVHLKRTDLYLAENLLSIYKVVSSGYFNEQMVKKTYASLVKSEAFEVFVPWLRDLKKLPTLKTAEELASFCESINTYNNSNLSLVETLNNSKQIACAARFTDVAMKNYKPKTGLTPISHNYIKNNVELFLSNENIENTAYFLSMLKEKFQFDYLQLSEVFSNFYMEKRLVPPDKILTAMQISPDLTKFIQINGYGHGTTKAIYYSQLDQLGSIVYNNANDEKDQNEVLRSTRQLVNYFELNIEHLPVTQAENRILSVGKSLSRRRYYKSSNLIFSALIKANNSLKEEAIFEYLWTDITERKYKDALETIKRFKLVENIESIKESQLLFWIGQVLIKNNDITSKRVFELIINKDPLSYYAVMAAKGLQDKYNLPPDKIFEKYLSENQIEQTLNIKQLSSSQQNSLVRLKAWSKLDNSFFIDLESNDFINVHSNEFQQTNNSNKKAIATLIVSSVFNDTNNHLAAFKNIYKGINNSLIGLNFSMLKNLFPRPYYRELKRLSKSFDPVIALSLIRQESGFDPRARSIVGARGLMQIMPATARRFKRRIKATHLYNPATNLKIGTTYFKKLLNKYDHNLVYALSAYNAGETRVSRWKDKYFTDDSILKNIENIPFNETRKYVKLIFRNMFFYKLLTTKPETTDSHEPNKIFGIYLGFNN